MRVGKHTAFLIGFVSSFADGDMSRDDFLRDYSGYVIEHFPGMERENARLARKFADTVDVKYEYAVNCKVSDKEFRILMYNALCDLLDSDKYDLF